MIPVHGHGQRLTKVRTEVTLQPGKQVEVKVRNNCMTYDMRFIGLELRNTNEILLVFRGVGWLENHGDPAEPAIKMTFTGI